MRQVRAAAFLIAMMALLPVMCTAQTRPASIAARIELPLAGYYRPGRAMEVIVRSGDSSVPIVLSCDGMIPIQIPPAFNGPVPIYILTAPASVELTVKQGQQTLAILPLHPLASDQRLIGVSADEHDDLQGLYPGHSLIPVRVGADRSWLAISPLSSLDAIVLREMEPSEVARFLAAGISVAAAGASAPDSQRPWTRAGRYWALHAQVAGPQSIVGGERVYLPTQGWRREVPAQLRLRVMAAGMAVAFLLVGCLLIKGTQLQVVAGIVVSILSCAGFLLWMRSQSGANRASGNIVVASSGIVQTDHWTYLATGDPGRESMRHADLPVAFDQNQIRAINLQMMIQADGGVLWTFALPANSQLALLRRRVEFGTVPASLNPTNDSPLEALARRGYLRAGLKIAGQLRSPRSEWGTTVIIPE